MKMNEDGLSKMEVHNFLIAAVLARLLDGGLSRQEFSSESFVDPSDWSESFNQDFTDCVLWLRNEGYVRFDMVYGGTNGDTCFTGIVLTAKCLSALEVRVDALNKKSAKEVVLANSAGDVDSSLLVKSGAFLGALSGQFAKQFVDS